MEVLSDLIKITIPAALALLGIYFAIRAITVNALEKKLLDMQQATTESVLPLKLQAYERLALFLERISLQNLVLRINNPMFNVAAFQTQLVQELRDEYNHNLSQQIYVSDAVWDQVKLAFNDTLGIIMEANRNSDPEGPALELGRSIFSIASSRSEEPTANALRVLKQEVRSIM